MWSVYKQTGHLPEILATRPEDPEILIYLWEWYWQIRAGERRDEWSGVIVPLTYADIYYWQAVTENTLSTAEIDLLFKWDRRRIGLMTEDRKHGNRGTETRGRQQRGQGGVG